MGLPDSVAFWRKAATDADKEKNKGVVTITPEIEKKIKTMLQTTYTELGSMSAHERGVAVLFLMAVVTWIFHDPKIIPGWSELFEKKVSISTSALAVSALFFVVPRDAEFYEALKKRGNMHYGQLMITVF